MKKALTVLILVLLLSIFGFTQNLAVVINALGARESTLTIFKQYAVTDDLTIPTNITLKFLQGGSVTITGGEVLTINGHVEAGLYQIFEGAGADEIVFGAGSVRELYPHWWGVLGNDADDTVAFQAAIDSWEASNLRGIFKLPPGIYGLDPITINAPAIQLGMYILGSGKSTVFKALGATDIFTITMDASLNQQTQIENISFNMNDLDARAVVMLGTTGMKATFKDIWVSNLSNTATKAMFTTSADSHLTDFINVSIIGNFGTFAGRGIDNFCNTVNIERCSFLYLDSGINLSHGTNIKILDNRIDYCNYGINNDSFFQISLLIQGNRFEANQENAMYIKGYNATTSRCFNVGVKDNYITGIPNGKHGAYFRDIDGLDIINNRWKGAVGAKPIEFSNFGSVSNVRLRQNTRDTLDLDLTQGLKIFPFNDITRDMKSIDIDVIDIINSPSKLTVSVGGIITITKSYHLVDGNGDADDDLDTINGFVDGMILILQAEDDAVTITIRDNSVGGGNIETEGDAAIVLDDVEDKAYFIYDATNSTWCEISRFTG